MGPMASCVSDTPNVPLLDTCPLVGLSPTILHALAGERGGVSTRRPSGGPREIVRVEGLSA